MSARVCPTCGVRYGYAFEQCSFCGADLESLSPGTGTVVAVTEVSVPSLRHEDVPYWCALVEDDDGFAIVKSERPVQVGDALAAGLPTEEISLLVGVVGSGAMGRGLAELLLGAGHEVVWVGRSLARLEIARDKVADRLARVMDETDLALALERLTIAEDYAQLGSCDIVIEAVVEELTPKKEALEAIADAVRPDCLVATNTSSLPLDALSADMRDPARFGGLHFFNPPTRMRLVETVAAPGTSEATVEQLILFARALGKIPVRVAAGPGFVVNRVLMPLINEAVRALEDGIAPAEDIDEAVRLGLNHPMGPLALADLIGLDVVVNIMDDLHARLDDDAYAPRPKLRELVETGMLGRKSGAGFYEYAPAGG